MNKISKTLLALTVIVGLTVVGSTAFACGGFGRGMGQGIGQGKGMGIHRGQGFGLIPEKMRSEFRADFQNMTDEQRAELRQQRQQDREQHQAEFEAFVGLSKDEVRAKVKEGETMAQILTDQGKTEAEAQQFLTDQANARVDTVVEQHNLDAEQEQTLRDRIVQFVQNILDRWLVINK